MAMASIVMIPALLFTLALLAGGIYMFVLIVRALRKYIRSGEARREKAETCRSLGEAIRTHRMRCQMTQEFVAEGPGESAGRRSASGRPARRTQYLQPDRTGEALRRPGGGPAAADGGRGNGGVSVPGRPCYCL